MNEIYTIGHSSYTQEHFLKLLRCYEINCIVDVRSTPYSKYVSQFNKKEIKKFLNQNGIYYIFLGKELGARREEKSLYNPIECHRNILVARQFYNQGFNVFNILENSLTETQEQLENRLLDLYFPERNQLTILDVGNQSTGVEKESLIHQAYSLKNKEIGYCLDNEKEHTQNEVVYHRVY